MTDSLLYPVENVKGMSKKSADALRAAGVENTESFLEHAKTPASRRKLAEDTGIAYDDILALANRADLMRVKGIGEKYGDLLEIAGVDTVPELAQRNAENLRNALDEANNKEQLVKSLPSVAQVQDWVDQASGLGRRLEY